MSQSRAYLRSVSPSLVDKYVELGIQSYKEHYVHLWKKNDPSEYLQSNFTTDVLAAELEQSGLYHFIAYGDDRPIGIVKLNALRELHHYPTQDTLLLEKIYFLKQYSGLGYGKTILQEIIDTAHQLKKKWLWLEAMQKGEALAFYLKRGFEIFGETQLTYTNAIEEERPMYVLIKELQAS